MRNRLLRWFVASLGKCIIQAIGMTLRWHYTDVPKFRAMLQREPRYIYAFWHNRLIMMPYIYRQTLKRGGKLAVMVSQSRDGQIIADIIDRYDFRPVRGSTTRGGKAALREMIRALRSDYDCAFTPDGPRGPRYEVGPGVVALAQLSGLAIIPVCFDAVPKWTLKSWDRMIIPKPFARAVYRLGDPIEVGADANANELQEKILEVKTALIRLSDQCALELTAR